MQRLMVRQIYEDSQEGRLKAQISNNWKLNIQILQGLNQNLSKFKD